MKAKRIAYSIITFSILLILTVLILNWGLITSLKEIFGEVGDKRIIVNLKQPYTFGGNSNISIKDSSTLEQFEKLQELLKEYKVSALSNDEVKLQNKWRNAQADVMGVNSEFFKFNSTKLLKGRSFSKEDVEKENNVIVIDEELSEELFNSTEILGRNIKIYDQDFKIIGVICNEKPIIESFLYDGKSSIYMPITAFSNAKGASNIVTIEVNTDKKSQVESAFRNAGINLNRYNFFELSSEERLVRQNNKIIIFVIGIFLILKLGALLKILLNKSLNSLKKGSVKKEYKSILYSGVASVVIILLLLGIWYIIQFKITIPKQYIPFDMPDVKFFKELFKNIALEKNQKLGYIASINELRFETVKSFSKMVTFIALIVGIPLLYLGNLLIDNYKEHETLHCSKHPLKL